MKDFRKKIFELIDAGASQAKYLIEGFNDVVESIDFNTQLDFLNEKRKELVKKGNELFGDFAELIKQIKESLTDFSVTVPFDETAGETINYEVKDGKLCIEVAYSDETSERSNKTSVLIPSNCDLEQINLTKNANAKTATVTIPKIVTEAPNEEVGDEPQEDGNTHVSSKLANRLRQNSSKYQHVLQRDANGNFVRRTPNTEEN